MWSIFYRFDNHVSSVIAPGLHCARIPLRPSLAARPGRLRQAARTRSGSPRRGEGGNLERDRRTYTRDRGPAPAHPGAQHGDPAHLREIERRHRPAVGSRQCQRAQRRTLRRHHNHQRDRRGARLRFLRLHRGGAPPVPRVAGRAGRPDAGQRDADRRRGRQGRTGGCRHAGPGAVPATRAAAGGSHPRRH